MHIVSAVSTSLLLCGALTRAFPLNPRLVTLDPAATAEAQKRDDTATRAFSSTDIKTSDGQCLFVVSGSGDFRNNLTPVQVGACDGSDGQKWDVITAGVHNDQPGQALIVSSLTQACLNFDPRRAAGNQVLLFSCGGRADGGGAVTNSQLFAFTGGAGPLPLVPQNGNGQTLLTVTNGLLDQTSGSAAQASGNELFTFGDNGAAPSAATTSAAATSTTVSATSAPSITPAPTSTTASATTTGPVSVSRAGVVLNPSAAAEANPRDNTATRALSSVSIKTNDGNCLSVDATAGDFRENLIPIQAKACDGSDGQKWDVITKGVHNDQPGFALIVSTLTQGCMNFDPRRADGDQVILFSCGGRADGGGAVTNSQVCIPCMSSVRMR
ncbi:hypothetical protein BD309DRAFT_859463 [Dichomitus squalens]|uniref:Uncharacterized protein n=1 Tax=Dichomitus squalens TaxID=114155 RepID=A0A4Q9N3W7_9APHY|nr:hypothetical protein BD311DRAFT_774216 [Dichomitus squalens]TBU45782.1 hypothetical protein BD309DRAFT_859463 [Dichomitus squalens]